jgi:hypothetical protein
MCIRASIHKQGYLNKAEIMGPELGYNIFSADEVLKSTEKKVFKGAVVRD